MALLVAMTLLLDESGPPARASVTGAGKEEQRMDTSEQASATTGAAVRVDGGVVRSIL